MNTTTAMPTRIINRQKANDAAHALHRAVQDVNTSLSYLLQTEGVEPPQTALPEDWQKIKEDIEKKWDDAKEATNNDLTLLPIDKKKRLRKWKLWYAVVSYHVRRITRTLADYPTAQWQFNEHLNVFTPSTDIQELAEEQAMEDVPGDCTTHAQLIKDVSDSVELLRSWEKTKNVRKIPLIELCNIGEETLAEMWVTQTIFYPTDYTSPQIIASREFREKSIL